MAIIEADTISPIPSITVVAWDNVTENDTAKPIITNGQSSLTAFTITGTFGGATVGIQGSLDGVNYFDFQSGGSDIAATADSAYEIETAMVYLRPTFTGGTGQNLKVTASFKG